MDTWGGSIRLAHFLDATLLLTFIASSIPEFAFFVVWCLLQLRRESQGLKLILFTCGFGLALIDAKAS